MLSLLILGLERGLVPLAGWQDAAPVTVIATLVSSVIGGVVAYLTKRSGDQAAVTITETTTRGDIEREAFERAEGYYTKVIDRQDREIHEQAEEVSHLQDRVAGLEREVAELRSQVTHYRRTGQRLARGVYQLRHERGRSTAPDPQLDDAVADMLADDA